MHRRSIGWGIATVIILLLTFGWLTISSPADPAEILPGVWQSKTDSEYSLFFSGNGDLTEWYGEEVTGKGDWSATKNILTLNIDSATYTYAISKLNSETFSIRNYESGELQVFSKLDK